MPTNPFQGRVDALSDDEFSLLASAVAARRCREEIGFATFEDAALEYRRDLRCPVCGSASKRDGRTPAGHQRYRCKECRESFSSLTGTIFEHSKKDLPTWVDFVQLMCFNVLLDAAAEMCRISHQTAWEWRHRVFATVDGYQDRIVLRPRLDR